MTAADPTPIPEQPTAPPYVRPDRFHNHDHDKMNEQDRRDHLLWKGIHTHVAPEASGIGPVTEEEHAAIRAAAASVPPAPEQGEAVRAALDLLAKQHRRVCAFCGGDPDDSHAAEWADYFRCGCRVPDCLVPKAMDRLATIFSPDDLEPCVYCDGRRWVEDENWTPDDPPARRGDRSPGDGLIPCGGCNEGGWNTPLATPPPVPAAHGVVVQQPEQPADAAAPRGETNQADPGDDSGPLRPPVPAALDVERLRRALFTEFRRSFWGREEGWARQVSRIVADNVAPEYARLSSPEASSEGGSDG